jgi:hypothetical protein
MVRDRAFQLWTIPREKAKNGRAHEVHLSDLAVEIIDELPKTSRRRADGGGMEPSPYLFTTNGERPVSGFSKAKERLDQHMVQALRAEFEGHRSGPGKGSDRGLDSSRSPVHRGDRNGPAQHRAARRRPHLEPRLRHDPGRRRRLQPTRLSR